MGKKLLTPLLLGISLLCAGAVSAPKDVTLQFTKTGFSIKPLEPDSSQSTYLVMSMYLPASEGMSPNVNILIDQPFNGTIDKYMKISKPGLEKLNARIIQKKKINDQSVIYEYTAQMHGQLFHFYSRAIIGSHKVYLATATATASQWKKLHAKLTACVDSFALPKADK